MSRMEEGVGSNNMGFLCKDNDAERLVTIIDEEEVVLKLSSTSIVDAEPLVYVYSKYKK